MLDVVVDRDDVGVLEGGQHARLGHEPGAHRGIGPEQRRELLDGDVAVELAVAGSEHDTPAAASELALDLVERQRGRNRVAVDVAHRRHSGVACRNRMAAASARCGSMGSSAEIGPS